MSENLSSAIKADEELDERLNTPILQHIQSIEILCLNEIFLSLKNKQSHSHKTSSRLLQMLVISPMNYKTNFMNIKIIRQHVIFFKNGYFLCSSVLCANFTNKYPNWLFNYYFHVPQHAMPLQERLFSSCTYQKRKHKIEGKLKMI